MKACDERERETWPTLAPRSVHQPVDWKQLPDHSGGQMCEGCAMRMPAFGLPDDRKARWCGQLLRDSRSAAPASPVSKRSLLHSRAAPHYSISPPASIASI